MAQGACTGDQEPALEPPGCLNSLCTERKLVWYTEGPWQPMGVSGPMSTREAPKHVWPLAWLVPLTANGSRWVSPEAHHADSWGICCPQRREKCTSLKPTKARPVLWEENNSGYRFSSRDLEFRHEQHRHGCNEHHGFLKHRLCASRGRG